MEKAPEQNYDPENVERQRVRLLAYFNSLSDDDQMALHDDNTRHARKLLAKYSDGEHCAMYHALIGSTIPDSLEIKYEDFPGEDSIAAYIDNLASRG